MAVSLALPSPSTDLWWLCRGSIFTGNSLSASLCAVRRGLGTEQGPLSFPILVAVHVFCTYQLQAMTCYQILALLRLDRQKEELGMECMSEVLSFLFILERWNANCGPETAVQQVFYIWTEKLHVFSCQSSCVCDCSCSLETQGQASFTELQSHKCSVQWWKNNCREF